VSYKKGATLFLACDAFIRTNRRAIATMFICLSPSEFHLEERWDMDVQTRWSNKR